MMAPALAWILDQLPRDRRLHRAGTVISLVAGLELALITVQAIRGVPSHFNYASRFDGALFSIMGIAITGLWLGELFIAVRAFRHRFATPARTWGIRLGLVGALLGGAVGFVMPRPTPSQVASLRAGQPTPILGAHAVGVPDGGPGLPIARWSTVGGDLRVPHFFGLHALQILPLAAWLLERRRRGARTVVALGAGWIGVVVATFIQAERGQPLLAPDALTAGLGPDRPRRRSRDRLGGSNRLIPNFGRSSFAAHRCARTATLLIQGRSLASEVVADPDLEVEEDAA